MMHEEISKWFLKGIAASPGIVIGKAYVLQDILLMVERRSLEEAHAEEEVARLKQAIRRVVDELMEDNSQMSLEDRQEGKQRSFSLTSQYFRTLILSLRS